MKEFIIDIAVSVPDNETEDEFFDKVIDFIENNGWYCGGGIGNYDEKDRIRLIEMMKFYNEYNQREMLNSEQIEKECDASTTLHQNYDNNSDEILMGRM